MIETMIKDEFEQVLVNCRQFLKAQAIKLTHDEERANDLIQETMLKAVRNRHKYRKLKGSSLESWLFVIMKNTFLSNYRKNKKRQANLNKITEWEGFIPSKQLSVNQGLASLAAAEIDEAMAGIRQEHRTSFLLYFQGYKYNEIADIMKLPLGTVKSHIHEARKALQKKLKDFADRSVDNAA
jgi:RNA polymerase sigma factor (sigma-70 family)